MKPFLNRDRTINGSTRMGRSVRKVFEEVVHGAHNMLGDSMDQTSGTIDHGGGTMGGIQIDDIRIIIVGPNSRHTSRHDPPNNEARIRNLINRGRIRSQVFGHACTHLGSAQQRSSSSIIVTSTGADVSLSASVAGCCCPADCCACSECYSANDAGDDGWGWAGLDKGGEYEDGAEEGSGESG